MLKPLKHSSEIEEFIELFKEVLTNSFNSLLGKSFQFSVDAVNEGELNDIALEYMGQTLVNLKESLFDIIGGMLFETKAITGLADLMMMGSGEGVSELNEELKDAIKELLNQSISAINIPFNDKFKKKVAFTVISVEPLMDTSSYIGNLIIFDISGVFDGSNIKFKVFFSNKLKNLLVEEEEDDFDFPQELTAVNPLPKEKKQQGGRNIDLLMDVEVPVSIRIGSTRMFLKDIVSLSPGNIVELDEYAEEPVVVMVNNKPIAKGEVVIVDGYFGVRIKEIISREERIKRLRD
ncbi:MAG: flagellar motor switch protein FliN [Calditerrivibrio sp.]|nr:flagellar motor switch protein FliN [Calditerrivibrio sp.]